MTTLLNWLSHGGQDEDKTLQLHLHGDFLHNYYTFVSLHDSDHEGVVRNSVALSCKLSLFN